MDQHVGENIIAALRLHGWRQYGQPAPQARGLCLGEAINLVCRGEIDYLHDTDPVHDHFRAVIGDLFPGRNVNPDEELVLPGNIITFNDHPDTSLEDVLLVIKHAVTEGA